MYLFLSLIMIRHTFTYWFGIEAGSDRVEAITRSWKGVWWFKALAPLIALGISQKTLNDITYRAMRGSLLNFNKKTYRAGYNQY